MGRNFLKGIAGNQLNTILATYGYNLKKIYKDFLKTYMKPPFFSLTRSDRGEF